VRDGAFGMSWFEVVKVAAVAVAILAVLAALYAFIAKKTGAPPHRKTFGEGQRTEAISSLGYPACQRGTSLRFA
jgi:hypothetical protein